jgi:hypothetical protein
MFLLFLRAAGSLLEFSVNFLWKIYTDQGTLLFAALFFDQRRISNFINLKISIIASTWSVD